MKRLLFAALAGTLILYAIAADAFMLAHSVSQPYRWVNPPSEVAAGNQKPSAASGIVNFFAQGSEPKVIVTDDGQALVSVYEGSFKAVAGQTKVKVTITPLDPKETGRPPEGFDYDSNAYRIAATYVPSGSPAELAASSCPPGQQPKVCPTIVMHYAREATALYRRAKGAWSKLEAVNAGASPQLFTDVPTFGTFVAVGRFPSSKSPVARNIIQGLAAFALTAAVLIGASARGRRWLSSRSRRLERGKWRSFWRP